MYISLSGDGLYAADRRGDSVRLPCPKVQVANATGGGDAMAAALAACIAHGKATGGVRADGRRCRARWRVRRRRPSTPA